MAQKGYFFVCLFVCDENWHGLAMHQHLLRILQNVLILPPFCTESRQQGAFTDPHCVHWSEDTYSLHPLSKGASQGGGGREAE